MKPGAVAIFLFVLVAGARGQSFSPEVVWTCGPLSFNCGNGQFVRGLLFQSEQAVRGAPLTLRFIAEEESGFEITFESFAGKSTPAEPHGHKLGLETIQLKPGEERELYYDTSPILIRSLEIHQIDDLTWGAGHGLSHWRAMDGDSGGFAGMEWRWGKTGSDSCVLEYRDTKAAKITYFSADVTYVEPGGTFTPPSNERTVAREGGNGVTERGTDRQTIEGGCAYVKWVRARTVDRK